MRIGYASQVIGIPDLQFKTCRLAQATDERLTEIISHNLNVLNGIFEYNNRNDVHMFRISSDIIPFGSHPQVTFNWRKIFHDQIKSLGEKARRLDIRLSMHPGQYTLLNTPQEDVLYRAVEDLKYHCNFLDIMGMDSTCKIVLHVGGVYGDRKEAVKRFKENYTDLNRNIRERLIIENDDVNYTIDEVYELGRDMNIPVVFDNLHNQVNPGLKDIDQYEWIKTVYETWKKGDGTPKIHYSQQDIDKKPGSHSFSISIKPFLNAVKDMPCDVDVMLEVKDKNLSAKKCILCTKKHTEIRDIEDEWAKYKYTVMEKNPHIYDKIKDLLKDKKAYPAIEFYELIEDALKNNTQPGRTINTSEHIWGYFKNKADDKEKKHFRKLLGGLSDDPKTYAALKRFFLRLSLKYEEKYLLYSYYFLF